MLGTLHANFDFHVPNQAYGHPSEAYAGALRLPVYEDGPTIDPLLTLLDPALATAGTSPDSLNDLLGGCIAHLSEEIENFLDETRARAHDDNASIEFGGAHAEEDHAETADNVDAPPFTSSPTIARAPSPTIARAPSPTVARAPSPTIARAPSPPCSPKPLPEPLPEVKAEVSTSDNLSVPPSPTGRRSKRLRSIGPVDYTGQDEEDEDGSKRAAKRSWQFSPGCEEDGEEECEEETQDSEDSDSGASGHGSSNNGKSRAARPLKPLPKGRWHCNICDCDMHNDEKTRQRHVASKRHRNQLQSQGKEIPAAAQKVLRCPYCNKVFESLREDARTRHMKTCRRRDDPIARLTDPLDDLPPIAGPSNDPPPPIHPLDDPPPLSDQDDDPPQPTSTQGDPPPSSP
ncbi:hypothetical protein C8Q72DRAFT_889966 [Fomitopsis betulina]|nr:hypothetical protein C8Q72DRAFT_889966 [Fomitopsis betulina]